jgi:TrfA protein
MEGRMSDPERLDAELARTLERLGNAIKANAQTEPLQSEPPKPAKIIQLPLWPEPVRGMPNPALRSALFSAIQSKDRRFLDHELIAAVTGFEIRFIGKQLNQEDLEVCAQVFHLARLHPLGDTCHMVAHAFLKSIGRHTGKSEHVQLHQSLLRLQAHSLEIKAGRYTYFGSLIEKGIKDELTRHYRVKVNRDLAPLFNNGWTALDAEQRQKLRGKPLALWLHAFYASHDKPYPYKVETLRDLSGSRTKNLFKFRQNLRRALTDLIAAGAIALWEIDAADLVRVHKVTAITQKSRK